MNFFPLEIQKSDQRKNEVCRLLATPTSPLVTVNALQEHFCVPQTPFMILAFNKND